MRGPIACSQPSSSRSISPERPVRAKKRLGQHFLHDPAVIRKLIDTVRPQAADVMVEIGGGPGALTIPLVERLERLHVVEIDRELAASLATRVAPPERLVVHEADALRFDFGALATGPRTLRVVGNLPYNISTPLLFHLLGFGAVIKDIHVMLQREVVDRMTASPGGKDYGRLTVMLSFWAKCDVCFDVGPGAFKPPPKVWSTVVRVTPHAAPPLVVPDYDRFARLVAHLFSMRRKTLGRSLKGRLTPAQIAAAGIDPGARAETLSPADFALLSTL
jgi:16S rRNA (adenine1518-N6/adenine1519-N6)-dimethyltransferase